MSKLSTIQHKFDALAKNYEQLLEEVVHQVKSKAHDNIHSIWHEIQSLRDIGVDEAAQLQHAMRRDLADAKQYLLENNKELKFWLGFEYGMLKSELWQKFKEATDIAPIEVLRFENLDSLNTYKMGEVIGLGTLQCDQCNKVYYFTYPSIIPACSQCNGTHFHRAFSAVD